MNSKKVRESKIFHLFSFFARFSLGIFWCLQFLVGNSVYGQNPLPDLKKPLQPNVKVALTPDITEIKIYHDRVIPGKIVTYTLEFSNTGIQVDNVVLKCLPPNIGRYVGAIPFSFWGGEVSKSPGDIQGPDVTTTESSGKSYLAGIQWLIPEMPTGYSGKIVFQLEMDVDQIKVTNTLTTQTWFEGDGIDSEQPPYDSKGVICEVFPQLEISKLVSPSTIFPGETFTVTIRYRKNTLNLIQDVQIKEALSTNIAGLNILDIVDVENIKYSSLEIGTPDEPDDVSAFPSLIWTVPLLNDDLWHEIKIEIPVKPYNDFRALLAGSSLLNIEDIATINQGTIKYDDAMSSLPHIMLTDLSAHQLLPKIFGTRASPGFPLFIYSEIKNNGHDIVSPNEKFFVNLMVDGQSPPDKQEISVRLDPDLTHPLTWVIDPLPPGEHTITLTVDSDAQIREVDETNNSLDATITVEFEACDVEVNRVTRLDPFSIGGQKPLFPEPIFSQIMVIDINYHYITDLALSLGDLEQTGNWSLPEDQILADQYRINQIWTPLNEVDELDPGMPTDPTVNAYKLTRIAPEVQIPISIALVLDLALTESVFDIVFDRTNSPIQSFINSKRSTDRIALITLGNQVGGSQQLLTDNASLNSEIKEYSRSTATGHKLVAGLEKAIDILKHPDVNGRKMVLLCTDNQLTSLTELEQIAEKAYQDEEAVPVFIFSMSAIQPGDLLRQLADSTGGVMMRESVPDLPKFMSYDINLFHEMFQNYYLLAFQTPDPTENEHWRELQVTLDYPNSVLPKRDTGRYKAPVFGVDLIINKALTDGFDSLEVAELDTFYYGSLSSVFTFSLNYKNKSTNTALNVIIRDTITSKYFNLNTVEWNPAPTTIDGDTLIWELGNLEPNAQGKIIYKFEIDSSAAPYGGVMIENHVGIYQADAMDEEANFDDNFDAVRIFIPPDYPSPPRIIANPSVISAGDSVEQVLIETFAPIYDWNIAVVLADGQPAEITYKPEGMDHSQLDPGNPVDVGYLKAEYTTKRISQPEEKITFRLSAKFSDGTVVESDTFVIVRSDMKFFLDQNVFLPGKDDLIKFHFQLSGPTQVTIKVYNLAGELVKTVVDENFSEGKRYSPPGWDGIDRHGNSLGSGVYIFLFEAEGKLIQRKLAVIR